MPRVLFLPHSARAEYFRELLDVARAEAGWRVITIAHDAATADARRYAGPDGEIIIVPSLQQIAAHASPADAPTLEMVAAAELASGVPSGRILLANERDLGVGFARGSYTFARHPIWKGMLSNSARPHDVLAALYREGAHILEQAKPDLVLAGSVGPALHFVVALLCRSRGIVFLTGRKSKVLSKRSYWTDDRLMYNAESARLCSELLEKGERPSQAALEHIDQFRNAPRTVSYIAENWQRAAKKTFLPRHKSLAILAARHLVRRIRGKSSDGLRPFFPSAYDYYGGLVRQARAQSSYRKFEPDQLAKMTYVYLPLHKEPELAQNFQAPAWHDQLSLAATIAASLPAGCMLLAREHRFNHGRRPLAWLRQLAALPGVTIVDPFDPNFKYIQNASLIVTDNGSSGWEGLVFKRPVLALDRTFYDAPGLTLSGKGRDLTDQILAAIRQPPKVADDHDQRLALLVDAELRTTFDDDRAGISEGVRRVTALAANGAASA